MNRYPLWKYITVVVALLIGLIYTLPNFFGESPAVQVSSGKATLKVDTKTLERVESTLKAASIESNGTFLDTNGVKVRLKDTDTQLKVKDLLEKQFNPDPADPQYVVAIGDNHIEQPFPFLALAGFRGHPDVVQRTARQGRFQFRLQLFPHPGAKQG